ncbi:hypothetical protein QUF72_15165 [Desulfobacterales bacterium HSG2]|nr:hypothetical protein [Desulfobacterales bacterium HSG2]
MSFIERFLTFLASGWIGWIFFIVVCGIIWISLKWYSKGEKLKALLLIGVLIGVLIAFNLFDIFLIFAGIIIIGAIGGNSDSVDSTHSYRGVKEPRDWWETHEGYRCLLQQDEAREKRAEEREKEYKKPFPRNSWL